MKLNPGGRTPHLAHAFGSSAPITFFGRKPSPGPRNLAFDSPHPIVSFFPLVFFCISDLLVYEVKGPEAEAKKVFPDDVSVYLKLAAHPARKLDLCIGFIYTRPDR